MWHLDEGTIHAWLDGGLSADEARRVEAHVGSCTACAEAVAEARGLIAASSRILTALDDVPSSKSATGATGTRSAKWERRSWTTWLVRERIAAVVAMIVAGGALALVVARNDAPAPASIEALSEPASTFELTVADSPTAPPAPSLSRERASVPAARATAPVAAPPPARDLAANRQADSTPVTARQHLEEVAVAETDLSRSQARTDDTLRSIAVAQAQRAEVQALSAEGKAAVSEKLANALPGRRPGADASARFAQPAAAEPNISGLVATAGAARAARLVQEERMMESGREVRRRIYRVDDILVTLDERRTQGQWEAAQSVATGAGRRALADSIARDTAAAEERLARVDATARAAAPVARKDSAAALTNTIVWTDARGAEFTLSGPASTARLAEIRKLLGY